MLSVLPMLAMRRPAADRAYESDTESEESYYELRQVTWRDTWLAWLGCAVMLTVIYFRGPAVIQ